MKYIIFDIDGTLADNSHRQHYLDGREKDWDGFFSQMHLDCIVEAVRVVHDSLTSTDAKRPIYWPPKWKVVYVTGRYERYRKATATWLNRNLGYSGAPDALFMRADGDSRPDWIIKKEIMYREFGGPANVLMAFDDRKQVIDMWRHHGITVFDVAGHTF
jgi:FMN phosphatase YigB (HAD superfamily)